MKTSLNSCKSGRIFSFLGPLEVGIRRKSQWSMGAAFVESSKRYCNRALLGVGIVVGSPSLPRFV